MSHLRADEALTQRSGEVAGLLVTQVSVGLATWTFREQCSMKKRT
jgi:hypothetical protein